MLISNAAVHFIADPEIAKKGLPRFLRHELPSSESADGIGSMPYSRPPQAFLLGLGYTNEVVEELRKTCEGVGEGVPWLIGGLSKEEFKKLIDEKQIGPPDEHGPAAAGAQKKRLLGLLQEGKGGRDGVFKWFEG